jgi:hypothetical protein
MSLNRYLYALANPTTLIDPTGHSAVYEGGGCGPDGRYCGGIGGDHAAVKTAKRIANQAHRVERRQRRTTRQILEGDDRGPREIQHRSSLRLLLGESYDEPNTS